MYEYSGDVIVIGFQETMSSIIDFLPKKRQTLLFSATQTRSIKDLARLSLEVLVVILSCTHTYNSLDSRIYFGYER
jgi:superfamily II DNA/RNA helicase